MDVKKVSTGIKVFGLGLGIVAVALLGLSLLRPAVTTGPVPVSPPMPDGVHLVDAGAHKG